MQRGTDRQFLEDTLRQGQVAIFPTDTVFGIGCRIDSEDAIKKVYAIKQRTFTMRLPVLLADRDWLARYVDQVPSGILKLIEHYWPGPLTIALSVKPGSVLPMLQNDHDAVSFRVPNFEPLQETIRRIDVPIVGTSANFHGQPPSINADQLDPNLLELVGYTFEGTCGFGKESTVIEYRNDGLIIHRKGSLLPEDLEKLSGYKIV